MALPGTPHCAKLSVLWTYSTYGIVCENTFYLSCANDSMFGNIAGVCLAVQNAVTTHLVPVTYPIVQYNGTIFEDVRTFPFGGVTIPYTAVPGTLAGGSGFLPSSAALAFKKVTGNLGRSGRGRWFQPIGDKSGLASSDVAAATWATDVEAALTAMQTDLETIAGPTQMGIVSYYSSKALRPAGLFQRITSWTTSDLNVDSQRRRLIGRGR